mmetsp:Transcript_38234/g.108060  ORF Transcript_38234/g.108060 Transcript_38234/m.108060 type:complete len:1242 (+) Transcript_38234:70-3795(+)|eukprot:CAMPEP_0117649238 /NCGR_PEP_ID=MMETSP0804-20121206/859_1 /TAXON_ID=1074897 /ORGANISM="Tetraselmis astigmatica, Strain CCMP880" /LENGTH=1241 /DNA_ID=CAMNT_0005454949 /DNA_START=59 /DNA_END=3784 /DNA_ORIENTATION=+
MFIYLSKKIAIPNNTLLKCSSWNSEQGWIACGGDNGLLKVLKLDSATATKEKGQAPSSNLSMNQTLEGHSGSVLCVTWNENYRKLTSSDSSGLIIVWMLHKGMWFEEMINNRNKSVVRDMKWTPDGQKICIAYEDGAVIVGSVDGNRLWGKELAMNLSLVEWSPDSRIILFCTPQGECHIYDQNGNSISKLQLYCMEGFNGSAIIQGVDWYDGLEGYCEPNCPVLAIAMDNGRMQLMRSENDENAILIDTGLKVSRIKWNTNGSVLGVAGSQCMTSSSGESRETCMVQFYSYDGQHLRTLRVPGTNIAALSWEGGGLRVALAVDSFVYFANVRPDYRWGYFNNTLVYAFNKPERTEACVMFWDTNSNDRYAKYVKHLMSIAAAGDYCVLATRSDEDHQFILILCNAIGSPVDSKYIPVEPQFLVMTQYHVIAASADVIYVWQYRSLISKLTSLDATGGLRRKEGRERIFHVDELPSSQTDQNVETWRAPSGPSNEPVSAIAASDQYLMIGRVSGVVNRYSLPHLTLEGRHLLRCRPQLMSLNCNSTRMSIIDINGVLSFFDLTAGSTGGSGVMATSGEHLQFERKDAWDMRWSSDNPELFAMMEKAKMYIFRGLDPEEPVQSSAYLCEFQDLEIKAVLLDEIMLQPDNPEKDLILMYDTRSLRDARHLLQTCSMQDAYSFIDTNSHARLWGLLAEHALENLDFTVADKAFVRAADYQGIQFVKHLQKLGDDKKQKAEIAAFFKRFDDAESIYRDIDRLDLAIEMRIRLGDWFKVEKLVMSGVGDDKLLQTAWNKIGEYYADRHKWSKAVQYFAQAKNSEMLVEAFYALEDFEGLEKLVYALPDNSPLLLNIGDKFQSVGLCEQGVIAFTKGGDVKRAVDCCVLLNQWDQGVALAEKHNFPQINTLLAKYASHLMEKEKALEAIELYRKANHHTEAAKLLVDLAEKSAAQKVHPLRCKKLYVLAAMEVERFRKRMLEQQEADTATTLMGDVDGPPGTKGGGRATMATNAATTLAGLMTLDNASATSDNRTLDNAWHGAEAFHFWLLSHRQMYTGNFEAAMRTALHLRKFEDVLGAQDVYSFLALASFYAQFFSQCSKAFIKLESMTEFTEQRREEYADLALSIFVKNPPVDPRGLRETRSDNWKDKAAGGGDPLAGGLTAEREEVCVASGKTIREPNWVRCKTCKHPTILAELQGRISCPLCHAELPNAAGGGRAAGMRGSVDRGMANGGGAMNYGRDDMLE